MQFLLDIAGSRPPDFLIGDPADPYLRRWWLVPRNDDCNMYLHHIRRNDDDRALHDHPWDNMTVVLNGMYREVTPEGELVRRKGDVVERPAAAKHRIVVEPGEAWTLFVTGPWLRSRGFWPGGVFVPWRDFVDPVEIGRVRRV